MNTDFNQLCYQVGEQTHYEVRDQMRAVASSEVGYQMVYQMRWRTVEEQVRDQVWIRVLEQTWAQIREGLWDEFIKTNFNQMRTRL